MSVPSDTDRWRRAGPLVVLAAVFVAVVGARPTAGGWNDGSRLAAVQALAEHGTFVIDDTVFVRPPPIRENVPHPYADIPPSLGVTGTLDKLCIDGHIYSDKSPVPSVLMAGLYRAWLVAGGPTVSERPDLVIRFLTVATSGFAYVFAVGCVLALGRRLGLAGSTLP
ncbi:MAG: hypothetical protein ACRC7O_14450, partial [Fimbriiglobus sp.]